MHTHGVRLCTYARVRSARAYVRAHMCILKRLNRFTSCRDTILITQQALGYNSCHGTILGTHKPMYTDTSIQKPRHKTFCRRANVCKRTSS